MTSRVHDPHGAADTTPMDGLLAAAREILGMELAYLAEVRESELVLREVDGDTAAYGGVAPGFTLPKELSWCHSMVAGEAAQLVPDADRIPPHPFVAGDRHPRVRRRARPPCRRQPVRHALLPEPRSAARAGRPRPALPRRARANGLGPPRGRGGRADGPSRRGRGGGRPGAARRAQRARELHGGALRGGAGAGARGRRRARHGRRQRDVRRPGRAAPRHRQGRRPGRDPAEARAAHRAGVGGHARAPEDRRADRVRDRLALAPRARGARRARALGRQRLSRRARRRGRPAREPHLLRLRRLARDDVRPAVPARAHAGGGARRARAPRRHAVLPDDRGGAVARARPRRGPGRRGRRHDRGRRADAPAHAARPAAGGRAAGADHGVERGRGRAPVRGGPRRGQRAGVHGAARRRDLDPALGCPRRRDADARERRRAARRRAAAPGRRDVGAHRARPPAGGARRAVRDRAREPGAAGGGARVPREDRPGLRARVPDPLRRPRLGRARGVLRRRGAAVHVVARALRGGALRPGRDGDRARGAVLAAGVARLPGSAHAAAEPAGARRAPRGGGRPRARDRARAGAPVLRSRRAQGRQRPPRATTPATARSSPRGRRWSTRPTGSRARSPAGSAATSSAC